jgi:hypothetical protein
MVAEVDRREVLPPDWRHSLGAAAIAAGRFVDLLDRISRLPSVEGLSVREDHLTDDSLRPIGRMRKLRV